MAWRIVVGLKDGAGMPAANASRREIREHLGIALERSERWISTPSMPS